MDDRHERHAKIEGPTEADEGAFDPKSRAGTLVLR
jgi:hypothetical protein